MQTKHCKRCDRTLELNRFHKDRKRPDAHAFYCKECMAEYGRKFRYTAAGLYSNAKGRQNYYATHDVSWAKPFEITKDEFVEWHNNQEKVCIYCDIPEKHCKYVRSELGVHGEQLTIDCLDNKKGYVIDNLALACHRCNATKSSYLTSEEMREIAQKYIKPRWQKIIQEKGV